jgi:hypothetical protein
VPALDLKAVAELRELRTNRSVETVSSPGDISSGVPGSMRRHGV